MEGKQAQIVQNFFTKCVQIIADARLNTDEHSNKPPIPKFGGTDSDDSGNSTEGANRGETPINRWFNLELREIEGLNQQLDSWKHIKPGDSVPPLVVECFLDPSQLRPGQTVALHNQRCTSTQEIVLERFVVECQPLSDAALRSVADEPTHAIYKQAVISMRALYTTLRLLPCYSLYQRLQRQKLISVPLKLGIRVQNGANPISSKGRIGLSKSVASGGAPPQLHQFGFQPVLTKLGALVCGVTYRQEVGFTVEDIEKLMALKFMELDTNDLGSSVGGASLGGAGSASLGGSSLGGMSFTQSSIGPKPILNFTRPFKSNVSGSAAGSANSNNIVIPTASSVSSSSSKFSSSFAPKPSSMRSLSHGSHGQLYPQSYGQTSTHSHGTTLGQIHGQSSGQSYAQSHGHSYGQSYGQSFNSLAQSPGSEIAEVNDFLKFVDDTRKANGFEHSTQSTTDVDAQLEKFQSMRQQNTQLSDSILETVKKNRRTSSSSRSRLYEDDDEMLFALGDVH